MARMLHGGETQKGNTFIGGDPKKLHKQDHSSLVASLSTRTLSVNLSH